MPKSRIRVRAVFEKPASQKRRHSWIDGFKNTRPLVRGFGVPVPALPSASFENTPDLIDFCRQIERSDTRRTMLSIIEESFEQQDPLFDKQIRLPSQEPYEFKYSKPGYIFTAPHYLIDAYKDYPKVDVFTDTGRTDGSAAEIKLATIHQCGLVEGIPEEGDALHEKRIFLQSGEPYEFKYSKPGYTFTGILCLPVSGEIQSPEAVIIIGGINCSFVTIRLTPVEKAEWACRVVVYGRLSTTGTYIDGRKQTRRADGFASERSLRKIAQCGLTEGNAVETLLYEKRIFPQSGEPYGCKYSKPGYTLTGILCLPAGRADASAPAPAPAPRAAAV